MLQYKAGFNFSVQTSSTNSIKLITVYVQVYVGLIIIFACIMAQQEETTLIYHWS